MCISVIVTGTREGNSYSENYAHGYSRLTPEVLDHLIEERFSNPQTQGLEGAAGIVRVRQQFEILHLQKDSLPRFVESKWQGSTETEKKMSFIINIDTVDDEK